MCNLIKSIFRQQLEDEWHEVEKNSSKKKKKKRGSKQADADRPTQSETPSGWRLSWNRSMSWVSGCLCWGQNLFDPSSCPWAWRVSSSAIPQGSCKGGLTSKHPLSELGIGSAFICKLQSLMLKWRFLFLPNLKDFSTPCKEITWIFLISLFIT